MSDDEGKSLPSKKRKTKQTSSGTYAHTSKSTSCSPADNQLKSVKASLEKHDISDNEGKSPPSKKRKTKQTSSGTYAHTSKSTSCSPADNQLKSVKASLEKHDISDNEGESPLSKKRKTYRTGRGKRTLHGYDYQLKLLMLFALNGKDCGVKFSLATEKIDSEFDEFDDLILRYEDNGKINYRFLQAKHSYSGDKIIKINDLLSESDSNNYSLQRYFKSYLIYDQKYKDGDLEDLIICSNDSFDSETTRNYLEEKPETDPILNLGGKIYQFKKSQKKKIVQKLKPIFKKALGENRKKGKVIFLDYLSEIAGNRDGSSLENECLNKIGDFLDKLVFAVEQPSGADLEKKIADKIGHEFNLINNIIYSQFSNHMSHWMQKYEKKENKEKDGGKMEAYYLTNVDLKKFFDEAKGTIASLCLINSNLSYEDKMEDYCIRFKDDIEELQQMKNFLDSKEKQFLKIICPSQKLLSGLKLCQVLKSQYKSDGYIFSDLEYLSILKRYKVDPLTAFKSPARNLLVIEHNSTNKEYMLRPFIEVLKDNSEKKIILIISKEQNDRTEEVLDDWLEDLSFNKDTKYTELEDKCNKLSDLSDESQKSLLEKEGAVIFQGREVTFSSLIKKNKKDLISGEVLGMLINNEKIEIGKEIEDRKYNEIKDHYIERKICRTSKVNETVENETFQYLSSSDEEFNEDDENSVLRSEDRDILSSDSDEGNSEVEKVDNTDFWPTCNLQCVTGEDRLPINKNKNIASIQQLPIDDKEVIIVSEPGMGKSMLLTHIALQVKKTNPCLLVLNIKLVEYSSQLNKLMTDNNNVAKIKFLYKTFLKKYTKLTETFLNSITITIEDHKVCIKDNESKIDDVSWLEVQLFNEFYNNGKVIFFFDGFDEISPDYKEVVIELLKFLKGSRSRIWITTRPYDINKELENELGVFSYCLEGFSEDEQQAYLKKFWSVDDERSNIYVTGLLEHFSKSTGDVERNFFGIPLHLNMLAVVFKREFKIWYNSGAIQFSISDDNKKLLNNLNYLYENFIDIKFFQIYIKEKSSSLNTDVAGTKLIVHKLKVDFLKDHMKLAAYSLLNETEVKLFLSEKKLNKMPKRIEDIKLGKEKTGIISYVADNKPVFVHRTFAEYFLSHLIYDKLKTSSDTDDKLWKFLIKQILILEKYRVIRRFLNCLFVDYKVDNNKSEIIKKLLVDFIKDRDDDIKRHRHYYYTPLHVACEEGLVEIVRLIIENQPDGLENYSDEYFVKGFQPSSISDQDLEYRRSKIVEKNFINLDCFYGNPLGLAVRYNHEDIVRLLLENGACITCNSVYEAKVFGVRKQAIKVLLDYVKSDREIVWFMRIILLEGVFSLLYVKRIEILEMLIKKLDNVNITDEDGYTPLHAAAMFGLENIQFLLLDGFDIEYQGRETSPIISIMVDTCAKVRSYLLDRGVIVKNDEYYESGWVRTVELLLEKGADENILNNNGKRPVDLVPDFNELNDDELYRIEYRIKPYKF